MKIRLGFLLFIGLFFSHSVFAQAKIYNETDKALMLVYQNSNTNQEETISVPAFAHIYWDEAPEGNFIVYIYQTVATKPNLIIEKLGFVSLVNQKQQIILDQTLKPLPVYMINTGIEEFVLEYNRCTIFLQAGQSSLLEGLLLNLQKEAVILLSYFNGENSITNPEPVVVKFHLEKDSLIAFFK